LVNLNREGLQQKHAVATWNLDKHLSICLKTQDNQENFRRDGFLYSIRHLVFSTEARSVLCEVRRESICNGN